MTRSRRLVYQAGIVVAMAAFTAMRAPRVEAAAAPAFCTGAACTNDCGAVWTSMNCSDCGGDAFPYCQHDPWNCPGFAPYLFGCAGFTH